MLKFKKILLRIRPVLSCLLVVTLVASAVFIGALDYSIPPERSVVGSFLASGTQTGITAEIGDNYATARIGGVPLKEIPLNVIPEIRLVPCGSIFGVKFFTKGVVVVGLSDVESADGIISPAKLCGIRVGDVITRIDQSEVNTVEEISQIIERSAGKALDVEFVHEGEERTASLIPVLSSVENRFKSGMWIRDSTAGIGTITFYNPETNTFGGLGHGICDIDSGTLMPMQRGNVVGVSITDIIKGRDGIPGELKGSFGILKKGALYKNSNVGVFGSLTEAPPCAVDEPIPIGASTQVHEGSAIIYSSLGDDIPKEYEIEIVKIYRGETKTKNFVVRVTDEELLERTGGIVQGMSGSPIVQDGKLIGAVTHVLINEPTKGYGIFIENMLSEA